MLVNCGFLEYRQNETALRMVRLFCRRNGYAFGSVLMLGSGEAILESPFRFLAVRKVKRFARSVSEGRDEVLHTTMPLPKRLFVMASTRYWIQYGRQFGITREQMQTPEIEGCPPGFLRPSGIDRSAASILLRMGWSTDRFFRAFYGFAPTLPSCRIPLFGNDQIHAGLFERCGHLLGDFAVGHDHVDILQ